MLPKGRLLVRSYDTYNSFPGLVAVDPEERYSLDVSDLAWHLDDEAGAPQVGDTVIYVGEVRGDDAPNVWHPMRVVHIDTSVSERGHAAHDPHRSYVRTWAVSDAEIDPVALCGESCLPRHLLTSVQWEAVSDLALSGARATAEQARVVLGIFDCAWVLDRKCR